MASGNSVGKAIHQIQIGLVKYSKYFDEFLIKALTKISHEKYSDLNNTENFDIICCSKKSDLICVQIFFLRSGKNLGNKLKIIEEEWINNNFELTDKQINKIINR